MCLCRMEMHTLILFRLRLDYEEKLSFCCSTKNGEDKTQGNLCNQLEATLALGVFPRCGSSSSKMFARDETSLLTLCPGRGPVLSLWAFRPVIDESRAHPSATQDRQDPHKLGENNNTAFRHDDSIAENNHRSQAGKHTFSPPLVSQGDMRCMSLSVTKVDIRKSPHSTFPFSSRFRTDF